MSDPNKPNVCSLLQTIVQNKRLIRAQPCLPLITGFSHQDFQMRRKAEVLKHASNQNKLTNKQKWSRMVNGRYVGGVPTIQPPSAPIPGCVANFPVSNSSTASDVPGTPTTLVFNPHVPLVHYRKRYIYGEGTMEYIDL